MDIPAFTADASRSSTSSTMASKRQSASSIRSSTYHSTSSMLNNQQPPLTGCKAATPFGRCNSPIAESDKFCIYHRHSPLAESDRNAEAWMSKTLDSLFKLPKREKKETAKLARKEVKLALCCVCFRRIHDCQCDGQGFWRER
ncbi:uncharacterized protein SPPG_09476 [Spizellomyces punctatus DAOM BR117]|uniref:Uncharacterized protein n=1 Tax=Spizellomyces punctatus (strain DAOM BR117) TaxID=645134 RepID=A0A0L0H853_SPIPD|nr:uncharacterized protein SPPG_09476 [Spizellomyces punctatus DAOM BR117]KNC97109.1 hypothetical protein SPPG_09476 [Spizellomyces punctatus DAOM BR117]|eukprot:XP_016605149.1 hypothetical protein SPPG_09476 [Spizellomyces punctatus DAOM BR117]